MYGQINVFKRGRRPARLLRSISEIKLGPRIYGDQTGSFCRSGRSLRLRGPPPPPLRTLFSNRDRTSTRTTYTSQNRGNNIMYELRVTVMRPRVTVVGRGGEKCAIETENSFALFRFRRVERCCNDIRT
jgi:hypothetical protein